MGNRWDYMRDDRHNRPREGCPKCVEPVLLYEVGAMSRCGRTLHHRRCENGHTWYEENGEVIPSGEWTTGNWSSLRSDYGAYLGKDDGGWSLYACTERTIDFESPLFSGAADLQESQCFAQILLPPKDA